MAFKPATREQIKLRMAIDGPSGSGKTITGLRLAYGLAGMNADTNKPWRVAVIDSESGSARKYVGEEWDGIPIDFDVDELRTFAPTDYTQAIEEAGRAGFDVLLIDSLSHAWEGRDGALEQVSRKGGNSFTAWKDVTPQHRRMIDAILTSPCHVIATMRSKTEYVLEPDDKGKQVPRRVGVAPVQRSGMEYEFDVYGSLDWSHIMTITKTRCRALDGLIVSKPGADFMKPVIHWLQRGSPTASGRKSPLITEADVQRVIDLVTGLGRKIDWLNGELPRRCGVTELRLVSADSASDLLKWLEAQSRGHRTASRNKAQEAKTDEVQPTQQDDKTPNPVPTPVPDPTPAPIAGLRESCIAKIKELYATWCETLPKTLPEENVKKRWQTEIMPSGVAKVADLTPEQIDQVIKTLNHQIEFLRDAEEIGQKLLGREQAKKGGNKQANGSATESAAATKS